jgi:hypothetical protein
MYLFAPRQLRDQYKRPIIYNFNNQFIEDTYGVVADMSAGGLYNEPSVPDLNRLYNMESAKSIIMPSAHGIPIKTSLLSSCWTFILTIDNDDRSFMNYTQNATNNRVVYYGFCIDEPINPLNMGGTVPTVNEGAFLIVTHKTIINMINKVGMYGPQTSQDTVCDVDVIPNQTFGTLTAEPFTLMTPESLRKATSVEEDGSINSVLGYDALLQNGTKHSIYNSSLNSPKHHGRKILNALVHGVDSIKLDEYTGTLSSGILEGGYNGAMGNEIVTSQIDAHLADTTNELYAGLPVNEPINLGILMRSYDPDIQPIYIDQATMFDEVPQHYVSANNIYSSLLSTAMPSILSNVGLLTLAFNYHSPNRALEVLNVENFIQSTPQETSLRVRAAISLLERDLFSIIIANGGHFDLMCSVSCGGYSYITLNLLDSTPHHGIYENCNTLGGVGSQLIGDFNTANHNISSLGNMISAITTTV